MGWHGGFRPTLSGCGLCSLARSSDARLSSAGSDPPSCMRAITKGRLSDVESQTSPSGAPVLTVPQTSDWRLTGLAWNAASFHTFIDPVVHKLLQSFYIWNGFRIVPAYGVTRLMHCTNHIGGYAGSQDTLRAGSDEGAQLTVMPSERRHSWHSGTYHRRHSSGSTAGQTEQLADGPWTTPRDSDYIVTRPSGAG